MRRPFLCGLVVLCTLFSPVLWAEDAAPAAPAAPSATARSQALVEPADLWTTLLDWWGLA